MGKTRFASLFAPSQVKQTDVLIETSVFITGKNGLSGILYDFLF